MPSPTVNLTAKQLYQIKYHVLNSRDDEDHDPLLPPYEDVGYPPLVRRGSLESSPPDVCNWQKLTSPVHLNKQNGGDVGVHRWVMQSSSLEPPEVKVTRQKSSTEDVETLVCRAHGFYPKEIEAAWTRDGESLEQETFRRRVAPNPDWTYYIWICIDVDPEEQGRYQCRVDHAGLSQPLGLAWEEPVGERQLGRARIGVWILVMAAVVGAVLAVLIISFCIFIFISK
uniref:Ig-like domain-containing protein n=1 Tax=Varanus komodoensis TaxID=61221 RepID=A0A8D2JDU5_VARKO